MITDKEKEFVKNNLFRDEPYDDETLLKVLNRKKRGDAQLSLSDLQSVFQEIASSLTEESDTNVEDSSSTPKKGDGKKAGKKVQKQIGDKLNKLEKSVREEQEKALAIEQSERAEQERSLLVDALVPALVAALESTSINAVPTSYRIVSGKTQAEVAMEVGKLLELGYVPFGGISAAAFGISPIGGNQYIQAMVHY